MLLEVPTPVTKIPGFTVHRCVLDCQPTKLPRAWCLNLGSKGRRSLIRGCWRFLVHRFLATSTKCAEASCTPQRATYIQPSSCRECDARQVGIRTARTFSTCTVVHCYLCRLYGCNVRCLRHFPHVSPLYL